MDEHLSITPVSRELERRFHMWRELVRSGGPERVSPGRIRELRMYSGQQGIWVDGMSTKSVSGDECGVTVSVLHKGAVYADDLDDDTVIYHYPRTRRGRRDDSEIEATKNAYRLGLPLFVIIGIGQMRNVRLGYVEDWDDREGLFLIGFRPLPIQELNTATEEAAFSLFVERTQALALTQRRPNQQRFQFNVFKRYRRQCAVCDLTITQLIEASHLVPWSERGADDPRNGLALCCLHHRALDVGLFSVHPESFEIRVKQGLTFDQLRITRANLQHLDAKPDRKALEYIWSKMG